MKMMKALVKKNREQGLWLEEVPVPQMGINDVLIKIHKTSICGTDVHIYNWDAWAQKTIPVPMVVGHEFVGTVAEVGSIVKGFKPGRSRQRGGALGLWFLPELSGRSAASLPEHQRCRGQRDGAYAEY